ncbi:1,4-dihydroxy-2-naphthoate octaprenyltransferase [Paraconexibacter sp. AEG42_29]|uniref:1,4-dihydroxy-2-naphthoate octaprenyltransferase n=1 Tax=Paraconexibacter sp. AEG42_29 TaxID=2997339 RepID=A0AAU7AUA0_9ACTN
MHPAEGHQPDVTLLPAGEPGRLALWIRATRPQYLPTSVVPGLLGALVALGAGGTEWLLLPVALLALLLVHAATDVCNDVEDAANGVDAPDKVDNSQVFNTGLLSIEEGRRLYAALFTAAFVLGVAICLLQGPALLSYGLVGIFGGLLYTAGPKSLKHAGLGDPAIVLLMGPLLTQGAYTAVTGDAFHAAAFWVGLSPGLLITAVLAGNNLSDIDGDRAAGVRTLAVRIGFVRARLLYVVTLAAAFAATALVWATGLFGPAILLPLVLAPVAVARGRQALGARSAGDGALLTLAPQTAQLHLLFCVLACVGVVIDRA